jgi:peptidoglycan hydrolase-like protein with peptidoglycan-binding domain
MIQVRYGDRGPFVVALQILLNRLPFQPDLRVDGQFGRFTEEAVLQFQLLAISSPTASCVLRPGAA